MNNIKLFAVLAILAAVVESRDLFDSDSMLIIDSHEKSASSTSNYQCEAITINMCSHMAYKYTKMPNFFQDSDQFEAQDRAATYKNLILSGCSQHIHTYICELLAPVCIKDNQETMKRFEIYPCRSFCKRIRRECEKEILLSTEELFTQGRATFLPGFACDQLPFDSNGGNGTLSGPCHEWPDSLKPSQIDNSKSNQNYRPYQPSLDDNTPPFITDKSPLFAGPIIKPDINKVIQADANLYNNNSTAKNYKPFTSQNSSNNKEDKQQATFWSQLQASGQNVLWTLIRYSNYLGILTLICLLLVLNLNRLRRFKNYLSFSGSSSSIRSSTNSSVTNHLHYTKSTYPTIQSHNSNLIHQHNISPSSPRSLVLLAGSNNQPPCHKLLPADKSSSSSSSINYPSQTLIHGLNQKTFINLQKNSHTTSHSNSSHHQYDYIPPSHFKQPSEPEQQPQLYSNILLSSPNHQVMLNGSGSLRNTNSANRPFHRERDSTRERLKFLLN